MDWLKEKINQIKIEKGLNNREDTVPIKGVIIGAGNRGKIYSRYAKELPKDFVIVGVAEPRQHARLYMKNSYNLNQKFCFTDWESLCKVERFADCAIICTQDQDHVGPAVELAKKGYHIMLEKPMAVTAEDCRSIYNTCVENNVRLVVCHVLRYHPSVKKLKEMIDSGVIGDVVNITHCEPVGYWHFAHSFVRGNWANEGRSTFSLLAKCCHDVDLIQYWMSEHKCTKISSFGSLFHFRKENKPTNAASRCLECDVESTCPFSAKKIYLDPEPKSPRFPMHAACDIENSEEGYMFHLKKAIETGPYGRCVYESDNDVCDNQVVNFQFDNGATATLTMIAFSKDICARKTIIYGTKGELKWDDFDNYTIQHFDFLTNTTTTVNCKEENPGWGHGGSDFFIIKSFIDSLLNKEENLNIEGNDDCLRSHLLTFAAEHSRLSGQILDLEKDSEWTK